MSSFGPKHQRKIRQISALESKKWSNHKIKVLHNVFNTLKSPYNHRLLYYKCLHFVDLTTFQILEQNLSNFFVGILVQTMTPKGHFEIN